MQQSYLSTTRDCQCNFLLNENFLNVLFRFPFVCACVFLKIIAASSSDTLWFRLIYTLYVRFNFFLFLQMGFLFIDHSQHYRRCVWPSLFFIVSVSVVGSFFASPLVRQTNNKLLMYICWRNNYPTTYHSFCCGFSVTAARCRCFGCHFFFLFFQFNIVVGVVVVVIAAAVAALFFSGSLSIAPLSLYNL